MKIVVPDDYPAIFIGSPAERRLRELGEVEVFSERGADQEDELARRIATAEVVLTLRAHAKFSRAVIAEAPKLRMISIWGTGYEHVDLVECRARGITVTNTPGANAHAVAEHTVVLMLAALRRLPEMDRTLRAGVWPREHLSQLEGKTVGLVGLGMIGLRVGALLRPFGVKLLAWTRSKNDPRAEAIGARWVPAEVLLREADIVSLHLRLTPETTNFLDAKRIAMMKPGVLLVNTARAGLVEKGALITALQAGKIAAALDVFHTEPVPADDPLLDLAMVVTPHNAGNTTEAIEAGLHRAVENVERYLGGSPRDVVVA
ncbi:MAG TPA: NAD(P)-dependent oxidoreductase [Gemmatimonadaceae bacterium]|jgi:phosphoglycerate dehydrogenase-like enzyme